MSLSPWLQDRYPKKLIFFLGFLYIFIVALLDYLTGAEISLAALYLPGIFIFSWYLGRRYGIFASLLSTFLWFCGDVLSGHVYSHPLIAYWNTAMLVSIFTAFAVLIGNLRTTIARHRLTISQLKGQKKALDEFAVVTETDADGKITYVNDQFCRISKYSREELIGKDHREVANSGYHSEEFWLNFWRTIQSGKIWHGDVRNKAKDGTIYWEDTTIVPFLGNDGKPEKYLAIRANITERKAQEKLLEERQKEIARTLKRQQEQMAELRKASEEVQRLANVKSQFTSMVSHELRTPLTVIKEGVGIVQDGTAGALNSEQEKYLDLVKKNVDRLARLINNVLDFQKLESRQMELQVVQDDINQLVDETKKTFAVTAKNKGLELSVSLEEGLPRIPFDRDRIVQVLTNLVSNAIGVMDKGKITLKTERLERCVRVSVEDQGPGIKEDLPKLFQPFSQLLEGNERKIGSSGLGLFISKQIIDMHQGEIGVESSRGKGATFYFLLPLQEDAKQQAG